MAPDFGSGGSASRVVCQRKRAPPLARWEGMPWFWQMVMVFGSVVSMGWTMMRDSPDSSATLSRWWTSRWVCQVPWLFAKKSCMVRGWGWYIGVAVFGVVVMGVTREMATGDGVMAGRFRGVLRSDLPVDQSAQVEILRSGRGLEYDFYQLDLRGADLAGVDLSFVKLVGCDLRGAGLRGSLLVEADLRGASLTGADLSGADLTGACLSRSRLEGVNLTGAVVNEETRFQLARYDSGTVWMEGFEWRTCGAMGPGASLAGAFLNTVDLEDADLRNANLMGAYLSGANLRGADLRGARMSGASLSKACLMGACLVGARLGNADLSWADFRAADLTGVELEIVESVEGADFYRSQNMSAGLRSFLLGRSSGELNARNGLTGRTLKESLAIGPLTPNSGGT